uniref:metalloprotease n=1 Tax=uncultured Sphingomonas sp. TaxID=158754 RepID=UPI0035CBEFA5
MRWIAIILMLIAYLIARGIIGSLGLGEDWLIGWAVCAVIMFFIVMIHEIGHAIVARRVGGDVHVIMVFPFQLDLRSRRFGLARTRHNGDVGGYVSYKLDRIGSSRKHVIIAGAGPFANLASAALVLGAMPSYPRTEAADLLGAVSAAFIVLSLGVGFANLLPFDGSDGSRILHGLRSPSRSRR